MYKETDFNFSKGVPFTVTLKDKDLKLIDFETTDWSKGESTIITLSFPVTLDVTWVTPLEPDEYTLAKNSTDVLFIRRFSSSREVTEFCTKIIKYGIDHLSAVYDKTDPNNKSSVIINTELRSTVIKVRTMDSGALNPLTIGAVTFNTVSGTDMDVVTVGIDIKHKSSVEELFSDYPGVTLEYLTDTLNISYSVSHTEEHPGDKVTAIASVIVNVFCLTHTALSNKHEPNAVASNRLGVISGLINDVVVGESGPHGWLSVMGGKDIMLLAKYDALGDIEQVNIKFIIESANFNAQSLKFEPDDIMLGAGETFLFFTIDHNLEDMWITKRVTDIFESVTWAMSDKLVKTNVVGMQ